MSRIYDTHNEIQRIYKKYKYPWLTLRLPVENLYSWGTKTAKRLKIDEDKFCQRVVGINWAVSHVQLSLGYVLIAKQEVRFPRGIKGVSKDIKTIPDENLAYLYFWFHSYMTIECLYRSWERITNLIRAACYPNCKNKYYFDGMIDKIKEDSSINQNRYLKDLKEQVKNWNKIAKLRNKLSHEDSSSINEIELSCDNITVNYCYKDVRQELEKLKSYYIKLIPAITAARNFIENVNNRD